MNIELGGTVVKYVDYIHDYEAWKEDFQFYVPIKVRFSETDMFGHLNNTVPFIYFEQARIEFLKHLGLMEHWLESNKKFIPIVANLQCDYIQQVFFDEKIKVYVKIYGIGTSSIDLHYMGEKSNGKICFIGRGTLVKLNTETGKGEKWSELERMTLEKHKISKVSTS